MLMHFFRERRGIWDTDEISHSTMNHEMIFSAMRVHPTNLPIKQGYSVFGYPVMRLRPQTHRCHAGVGAPFRVATLLAPDSRRW